MLPQHNNKSIENACYLTTIEVCKAKGLSDLQGYDITLVYVMQLTNKQTKKERKKERNNKQEDTKNA